jgi:hypothetical protein
LFLSSLSSKPTFEYSKNDFEFGRMSRCGTFISYIDLLKGYGSDHHIRAAEPMTKKQYPTNSKYILNGQQASLQQPYARCQQINAIPLKYAARNMQRSEPPQSIRKPLCQSTFAGIPRQHLRRLMPGGAGLQGRVQLRHQQLIHDHSRFKVQRPELKDFHPSLQGGKKSKYAQKAYSLIGILTSYVTSCL